MNTKNIEKKYNEGTTCARQFTNAMKSFPVLLDVIIMNINDTHRTKCDKDKLNNVRCLCVNAAACV